MSHVYLWLAHMATTEADAIAYAYPRPDGWDADHEEWEGVADRCAERVLAGLDDEQRSAAWSEAMGAWEVTR